jgi:hypothetical protein
VKFSDENSDRDSENDKDVCLKRDLKDCNLVVTGHADTVESAVAEIDKMKATLSTVLGAYEIIKISEEHQ